jgi:hypothetical protein
MGVTVRTKSPIMALALASAMGPPALAQNPPLPPALDAPWTEVAPAIDPAGDRVVTAALGLPDDRYGRLAARRTAAREAAEERARRAIHAWADDALAGIAASPAVAAAVHRAIDRHARVTRVRPLADGAAIVEIEVPLAPLRAAADREGLPWSRS